MEERVTAVLVLGRIDIPEVFDNRGNDPRLVQLVHPVGDQPGGENEQKDARPLEEPADIESIDAFEGQ